MAEGAIEGGCEWPDTDYRWQIPCETKIVHPFGICRPAEPAIPKCPQHRSEKSLLLEIIMAEKEGLHKARLSNNIDCLTGPICLIEAKGIFRGLSNRADPPPETETAAPTGIGNGGDQIGKQGSYSEDGFYSTADIGAIAKTHPIIARHFFGYEELEVAA